MRLASARTTLIVGLCVLLSMAAAIYLALTASTGLPGQSFRVAHASFENVGGLRIGDEIRMASVRVGQVRSITFEEDKANVVIQLDSDVDVFQDATATVVARSALGQNFVMLDPGTQGSGALASDGALKAGSTTSPVNLDEVLSALDPKTRAATARVLRQVGGGTIGHSEDLNDFLGTAPDSLRDLGTVARTLSDTSTNLDGLLNASSTLAGRFEGRQEQIGELLSDLRSTTEAIATDKARPLDATIGKAPRTLESTRRAMVALRRPLGELRAGMRALRPGARSLADATPSLRGVLREGVVPLKKVPAVAHKAVPAVRSLTGLMSDARPLARRLRKTLAAADPMVAVLGNYAADISRFFTYWTSANGYRDGSGHWLRLDLVVRPESFSGTLGDRDPFLHRNPYPAPGRAEDDVASTLLGGN